MASVLRFTDGTTTVTFDGTTDGKVVSYDIMTPQVNRLSVSRITRDGEEVIAQSYQDVTETMELMFVDTVANIKTKIQKLNRLWERMRRVQEMPSEPSVYIEVKPEGDADWWRSEIVSVASDLESQALDMYLAQGKMIFSVTIQRKYFWEKSTEVELSLYNAGQAKGTGGKTIYNCNDGYTSARYNYVDIDNADLVGDLPSRIRLKMYNSFNSATRDANIFAGLAFKTDVANFTHVIEGEASAYGTQKPVSADYANYSGGYYREFTGTWATETLIGRWTLNSTFLNATKSNYFMIYLVFNDIPYSDLYFRAVLTAVSGTTTLWSGPQVLAPQYGRIIPLGAVQLPPIRQIGGSPYPIEFDLRAQRAGGGAATIGLDYILFSPMDTWRQYVENGYGLGYQAHLMDDGPNERLYTDGWTDAGHFYNYAGYGPYFLLTPVPESTGKHRIAFIWNNDVAGSFNVARTMTIQAWYRPRRKQI